MDKVPVHREVLKSFMETSTPHMPFAFFHSFLHGFLFLMVGLRGHTKGNMQNFFFCCYYYFFGKSGFFFSPELGMTDVF